LKRSFASKKVFFKELFMSMSDVVDRPADVRGDRPRPWAHPASAVVVLVLILALGFGLRFKTYLSLDGLNHDDALLSSNVIRHDEAGLLKPLEFDQAAPVGHLLLLKEVVRTLGTGERVLRLPALVASLLAMVLFAWFLSRVVPPAGQFLALALIATSGGLLYFGASVKQYSGDVLVSVVLLSLGYHAQSTREGLGRFAWLGVAGLLAILFSQPSVFMLGGIGLTLILGAIIDRRYRDAMAWVAVASAWLALFATLYLLIFKAYVANDSLLSFWKDAFAPFPPRSPEDLKWYSDNFFGIFEKTLGMNFTGLAGVLFLAGIYGLVQRRRWPLLGMLLLPLLLTLAASALKRYPFAERVLLFTCPILATLIGVGFASLLDVPSKSGRAFMAIAAVVVLLHPAYMSFKLVKNGPNVRHDIKPALAYVSDHYQPGDEIYLDYYAVNMTNYYRDIINYKDIQRLPVIRGCYPGEGPLEEGIRAKDLAPLFGKKRVWIVFGMVFEKSGPIVARLLDPHGVRLDEFRTKSTAVLLYDLSQGEPAEVPPVSQRSGRDGDGPRHSNDRVGEARDESRP
jgi:hypothetical protein